MIGRTKNKQENKSLCDMHFISLYVREDMLQVIIIRKKIRKTKVSEMVESTKQ